MLITSVAKNKIGTTGVIAHTSPRMKMQYGINSPRAHK